MIIAVLVKRVPDTASLPIIREDGKSIEFTGIKFVMSPYDEYAVEEAIRLRDQAGGEVVVVSAGPPECAETIRTGLAMGADSGMLITGAEELTSKGLAAALAAALKSVSPDVIFAGKQAVDSDGSQVPERVAEILGIPHASCITRFTFENGKTKVDREVEGGHYRLVLETPALFTTQKGINEPRYPTLPNIMKAKRKPINEIAVANLVIDEALKETGMRIEQLEPARQQRRHVIFNGSLDEQITDLCRALREDEKVI